VARRLQRPDHRRVRRRRLVVRCAWLNKGLPAAQPCLAWSQPALASGPLLGMARRLPSPHFSGVSSAGLDFGFVRHPFQPNSGKKKISDFVRRRRWIRTRVPQELAPPRATAIAADSTSWSGGADIRPAAAVAAAVAQAAAAAQLGGPFAGAAVPGSQGGQGSAEGARLSDGETENEREVHAVVEQLFSQVLARASMQEALAQQIGSRTDSGGSIRLASRAPQGSPGGQEQDAPTPVPAPGAAAMGNVEPTLELAPAAGPSPAVDAADALAEAGSSSPLLDVTSASPVLPDTAATPLTEPLRADHATAPLGSGISFAKAADTDQLPSPSQQLRGFERGRMGARPPTSDASGFAGSPQPIQAEQAADGAEREGVVQGSAACLAAQGAAEREATAAGPPDEHALSSSDVGQPSAAEASEGAGQPSAAEASQDVTQGGSLASSPGPPPTDSDASHLVAHR
jgi:hypothetical protein